MPSDYRNRIEPLNKEIYDNWIIHTKAKLCQKKLWVDCQTPLARNPSISIKKRHMDTADTLIPIISKGIRIKVTETKQNNGYLLWEKLKDLFTLTKDQLFYTFSRASGLR
jgi:hypothetical protein